MKVVSLDIDSGERDPTLYPSPNDYTIRLNKTLYGVTNINLVSARLPNCQNLINFGNKQFQLDNKTYVLPEATYTNGTDLASNLQIALTGSNITQVTFNTASSKLTFSNISGPANIFTFKFFTGSNGYANNITTLGPPATVLGFNGSDIKSSSNILISNIIDLKGPRSLFVRITCKADDFDKDIIVNGGSFSFDNKTGGSISNMLPIPPNYIGRILLTDIGTTTIYSFNNDKIEYDVPNVNVDELRIRFYWNNGTKLIPYDFGTTNHIIKFNITCENDRFSKIYDEKTIDELPPPVDLPPEPFRTDTIFYVILGLILFIGLFLLLTR